MSLDYKLVTTSDGSHTLFVPELNEHYHSVHGAVQESNHVFIEAGLKCCNLNRLNILEIGFGTGLNALLTFIEARKRSVNIYYHSLEKFPLPADVIKILNYSELPGLDNDGLYPAIIDAEWNAPIKLDECFMLEKSVADLVEFHSSVLYDLVYFDAFAPQVQPELWMPDVFQMLYDTMNVGSILTTYCAKGQVRRNMQAAGFVVERLPGPPGKREMLRAKRV
jgi:tRNA U34 5-methylaminomethyl-2-thiouridine-forming methyltransferase MnmC